MHCCGRLVDRGHLRRHRPHGRRPTARHPGAAVWPAGIHLAAGARADFPGLHVVDFAGAHLADGLPRADARHDRHRQHDRAFPLQLRSQRAGRRHRHRSGGGRAVRAWRNPVDAEPHRHRRGHFAEAARSVAEPAGVARGGDADRPGIAARLHRRHHPGLGACHFQLPVLCPGKTCFQAPRTIRQGRRRRRRRPRIGQQRRLHRRVRADAGARHSDQPDHRGADRRA